MQKKLPSLRAFTLVEVLVVVLIIGVLMNFALPAYLSSVFNARQGVANANAKTLALSVQAKAVVAGTYDTVLTDYASDMNGTIPLNPCTGTTTGYTITATSTTATVTSSAGTACGTWAPNIYSLTL